LEFQIKIPNWDLSFKLGTSDLDEISALNSVALCPVQVCYAGSASLLRKDAMSTLTPTNLNRKYEREYLKIIKYRELEYQI